MKNFKITVRVPVDQGNNVRRIMTIELSANSLMEALQVARGTYGSANVLGGTQV